MTVPLIVLAILSTVGGLVGIPYAMSSLVGQGDINVFEHILEPVVVHVGKKAEHETARATHGEATTAKAAEHTAEPAATHNPEEISTERSLAILSVLLAAFGIAIGWFMFGSNPLRKMPKILEQKWRIDELYNGYIVDPITRFSREGLWKGFDLGFVDGIVNGIGSFVVEVGSVVRHLQVGFVRSYAAIILLGALAVLGYFIYYGLKLVG
jgi:NADH-quinone oxidoreductase subunit L